MASGSIDDKEELTLCFAACFGPIIEIARVFERECVLKVGDIGFGDGSSIEYTELLPKGSFEIDICRRNDGFRSLFRGGNIEA